MLGVPFCFWRWYLQRCFELLWVWFHTMPGYEFTKYGTDVHLKWNLSLFSFRFTCLHIWSTFIVYHHGSLLSTSYPTTKLSSAIPNTFGKSLYISYIFLCNISPAGAAPNSNLLYLYLPQWHANVVRYEDLSSSFRLW